MLQQLISIKIINFVLKVAMKKKIHLYPDRPEVGGDVKFAHSILAKWLENLLTDIPAPFRVALTGELGAGKSTVIHNALASLEKETDKYIVSYVDVWKLDQSSARRSTILKVAKDFKLDLNSDKFQELHRSMYGTVNAVDDVKVIKSLAKEKPWRKQPVFWFIILLSLALGTMFWSIFDKNLSTTTQIGDWAKIVLGAFVTGAFFISSIISQKILQVKSSVSQAPFVGPEEFEDAFQQILEAAGAEQKRAIVVFDNIDRAPKSKTEEILTGIAAFFDHSSHRTVRNLIILVPFSSTANKELDNITVQKFFDAIIPMPNIVPEDLMDFTTGKIKGLGWDEESHEIAQLIDQSDIKTPRSIIHFVNEIAAHISLAEELESNTYRDASGAETTFLRKGSISDHKTFYAKFRICEYIYPQFANAAKSDFLSPAEAMNPARYEDQSTSSSLRLYNFLRSTEGTPEKLPETLEPFIYFKGSDLELSIPGSAGILKAMNNRMPEEIKEFCNKENNTETLLKLFTFNTLKNSGNYLRLKNTILATLESFEKEIVDAKLRKSISKAIVKTPQSLNDIPIAQLSKVTPVVENQIENSFVWIELDNRYQLKKLDPDSIEWCKEYLKHVLKQPGGSGRARLSSDDIKAEYVLDESLFSAIESNGIAKYFGVPNLGPLFRMVAERQFKFSTNTLENLGSAINMAIKNSGTEYLPNTTGYFNTSWALIAGMLNDVTKLKELLGAMAHHFKKIEKNEKCPENNWVVLCNLNSHTPSLNNLITVGELELISFLLMINLKTSLNPYTNLMSYVRNFLNKADLKLFASMENFENSWDWIDSLKKLFPNELEAKVKVPEFCYSFSQIAEGSAADYLIEKISIVAKLPNFKEIYESLPESSTTKFSKIDFIKHVCSNPENFKIDDFLKALSFVEEKKITIETSQVIGMFRKAFNENLSEDNIEYLTQWSQKNNLNLNPLLNEFRETLEAGEARDWKDIDSNKFHALVIGGAGRPNDYFNSLFDKAIERGVFSALTSEVALKISRSLIHGWKNGDGVSLDNMKRFKSAIEKSTILEEAYREKLIRDLEKIAKNNKLTTELGFEKQGFAKTIVDSIKGKNKKLSD